jgi:hypothetical protein
MAAASYSCDFQFTRIETRDVGTRALSLYTLIIEGGGVRGLATPPAPSCPNASCSEVSYCHKATRPKDTALWAKSKSWQKSWHSLGESLAKFAYIGYSLRFRLLIRGNVISGSEGVQGPLGAPHSPLQTVLRLLWREERESERS